MRKVTLRLYILLFSLIIVVIVALQLAKLKEGDSMNKIIDYTIEYYSKQYGVDVNIVRAIVMTESSGNPKAFSNYARGLMGVSKVALQHVNLLYGLNYTYDDMFDVEKNIQVGILYFKWLYDYFYNRYPLKTALMFSIMAYNWGIGNVVKWIKQTEPSNSAIDEAVPLETKNYILDFLWWYNYYVNQN